MKTKQTTEVLQVSEIRQEEVTCHLLGSSPGHIQNRYSLKAWKQLLLGSPQMNRAELASRLKHDPINEFREATYRNRDPKTPTMFHIPNEMIHGALASAALDIPGAKKTQIERLTQVIDVNINLYGVPKFFMAMVRSSDINRTPDVRTRPIYPEWACSVTVRYTKPQLTERVIGNLLGAAGKICGIGDWRMQKGGRFGGWDIVSPDNAEYKAIVKHQGRAAQQKAWDNPVAWDADTEELFAWYQTEVARREMEGSVSPRKAKAKVHIETNGGDYIGAEA